MRLKQAFLFVIACLFMDTSVLSQHSQEFLFDHYGPAQGLHSSEVFDIIQSSDRYLWLATDAGLVRYDGHTFRYYTHDPDDTTTISHDYVTRLIEDKHQRIWVAAGTGVDVLYPETERFSHLSINAFEGNTFLINPQSFAYHAAGDTMWISSDQGIYYSLAGTTQLHKLQIADLQNYHCSGYLTLDNQRRLLVSSTYGIFRIDQSGNILQVLHHPNGDAMRPDDDGFFSHYEDNRGTLWSGNWSSGLTVFTPHTEPEVFLYSATGQNAIYSIAETAHTPNTLFLGTIHGLKTFDIIQHRFTDYSESTLPSDRGVPGAAFVVKLFGDALWIGTSKGLHCLDFDKHLFSKYHIPGLKSDVYPLSNLEFERSDTAERMVWFDIPYFGAYRYDLLEQRLADIPDKLSSYTESSAGVHTVFTDSRHHLWISSVRNGLSAYDLQADTFRIRSDMNGQQPLILGFAEGHDGTMWCTGNAGIWYMTQDTNLLQEADVVREHILHQKKSLFTASSQIDMFGRLWFISGWSDHATPVILCYDHQEQSIRSYDQDSISALERIGKIEGVFISHTGACHVFGEKGFASAEIPDDGRTVEFQFTRTKQYCYTMTEDHQGRLWISLKTGLMMYDPATRNTMTFDHHNSTVGNTSGPSLTFSPQSHRLYVSQTDHFSILDLDRTIAPECPAPVLSALSIKEKEIRRVPRSGESLSLRHHQNVLLFSFTNFSYTDSELNTYAYRLHPDDPWEQAAGNTIHLNNLGYGNYVLEVMTANAFGVTARGTYILDIRIAPPFTRTWFFIAMMFTVAVGGIYVLYRYRLRQLQRLNQIRLSIARDLHDDMGGNLSQVKILSEIEATKPGSNPVFQKINTKLGTIMDNMSEIVWSINPQKDDLSEIILHIQEYAVETLEPQGINLHFRIDPIPEHIRFNIEQRRHFYLLFKEAINNIAKYSQARNVTFELRLVQRKIHASISDDGVGFDSSLISRGNGLRNMNDRARMLRGELEITTSSKGTTIVLTKVPW